MIDIHAHILPGIDDGAQDIYDTLEMAEIAAACGVSAIIATPHCNIPGDFDNYFGETYKDVFIKAARAIQKEQIPVRLLPGMEVFGTYDLPDLIVDHKIMPLNQSRYILIEFAFDEEPEFAADVLRRVREIGAKPVIAHPERYHFVQDQPQIVSRWKSEGYAVQVNKSSFLGGFGRHAQNTAYRLLKHNLITVSASDCHGPHSRTPDLLEAYQKVSKEYSVNIAKTLFQYNPERICGNREVLNPHINKNRIPTS